jgi:ubiquinone/menaquinone biosynthesis C-methylase UbiE
MAKNIIDVCCGSKMFWFDKNNPDVVFADIRKEKHVLCDGRKLEINPDIVMDFTKIPFSDNTFKVVVFDPPHLNRIGINSWMAKKYGKLYDNYEAMIKKGFEECFRILKTDGTLIFKWNETQIKTSDILKLTPNKPLIGHKSGKRSNTHWICFLKEV